MHGGELVTRKNSKGQIFKTVGNGQARILFGLYTIQRELRFRRLKLYKHLMEKEEGSKQVIAAIFGTIEGTEDMELGPSMWMKDVIKGMNACRKGRGDDVAKKVEEEGITWLPNKRNYALFWGKEVEYERSYDEW